MMRKPYFPALFIFIFFSCGEKNRLYGNEKTSQNDLKTVAPSSLSMKDNTDFENTPLPKTEEMISKEKPKQENKKIKSSKQEKSFQKTKEKNASTESSQSIKEHRTTKQKQPLLAEKSDEPKNLVFQLSSKVSVHVGQSRYLKNKEHTRYLQTGLGYEEKLHLKPEIFPDIFFGIEANKYTSKYHQDLYSLDFKVGPRIQTKFFDFGLHGQGGLVWNEKGDTNTYSGLLFEIEKDITKDLSLKFFAGENQVFSKFGFSLSLNL